MDTFSEHMIKKKKSGTDYAIIALTIAVATIAVFVLFTLYVAGPISMLAMPLQAFVVFLAYKMITSRSIEFEYTYTNGYLEVDKIINKQSRKHLVDIEAKSVFLLAPYNDDRIPQTLEKNIINASSGVYDDNTYCIVFGDGEKKVLVFEPTDEMLNSFKMKNPRNVFIK